MSAAYSGASHRGAASNWSRRQTIERLDRLSRVLDVAFEVPGTNIRFGVEAIIRLVPGIGDLVASSLSSIILYEAHRLGVPRRLMIPRGGKVAMEGLVGGVPLGGDPFHVMSRANRRNMALLREYLVSIGEL